MKLTCINCQHQIHVDDSKIPGGVFKVKCPKCGKIVTGQKEVAAQAGSAATPPSVSAADELQAAYSTHSPQPAAETPGSGGGNGDSELHRLVKTEVGHLRKELMGSLASLFGHGKDWKLDRHSGEEEEEDDFSKKALICEDDSAFVEIISDALKRLGYKVDIARTTAEALKRIENGAYNLITVDYNFPDDKEGGVKIIARLNGQKSSVRRETFVVLISVNVKSADASAAFFHGANITVNKEEIRHLEHLIREGQRRFHDLYRVFNRIVEEKNEKL